ncbi:MAG TPA: DUF4389 domain-containing protein [Pseudonocardiaceae bacterium]|nr:DUF4389 domain-containing protein [Pseudonocardiaceae bacterium]
MKWLLLIPHYIVLAVLWFVVGLVSIIAFFAILITARYPKPLFDFTAGVLRWSWRVSYYGYSALGTDRYPPFALRDMPDYPAGLEIAYPQKLSRGLVLVKWWLLVLPQYAIVAAFTGGSYTVYQTAPGTTGVVNFGVPGLLSLLVLFAAVALLFTGRYPGGLFALVMGVNRWTLRVAGYALLLTDTYPPFRMDLGGEEPEPATDQMPADTPGDQA